MKKTYRILPLITQVGINMFMPIFIMTLLGVLIDRWLNLAPLFLIIGLVIGVIVSFRNLYFIMKKMIKDMEDEE